MHRPLVAILTLAAVLAPARANVAPEPEFGPSLSPRTPTKVAMTAEVVKILLGRNGASVRATFDLKNTGDRVVLDVGFPDVVVDLSVTLDDPPADGELQDRLLDFQAMVDGMEVSTTRRMLPLKAPASEQVRAAQRILDLQDQLSAASEEESRQAIRAAIVAERLSRQNRDEVGWMLWTMEFAAGQAHRVDVSYRVPYCPTGWHGLFREGSVGYVLKTGAPWEGPIGRAVVEVRYGEGMSERNLVSASPAGFTRSAEGLTWDRRDFEPTEDIAILVQPLADATEAADYWLAQYRKLGEARRPQFPELLANAAACLELAGRFEECLAASREVVALEAALRAADNEPDRVVVAAEPYVPWEVRIVRCLVHLGRVEEARESAKAAVPRLEALRPKGPRGWLPPSPRFLRGWIEFLRTFADGGPAPD